MRDCVDDLPSSAPQTHQVERLLPGIVQRLDAPGALAVFERALALATLLLWSVHEEVRDNPRERPISTDSYLPPELVERIAGALPRLIDMLDALAPCSDPETHHG